MRYYSTNKKSDSVDFKEATVRGQAPDKGLYFPEQLPKLPTKLISNLKDYSKEEIAFTAIQPYVGESIPTEELRRIVAETVNFGFPLVQVTDQISSLELFHGPTLAFKDVGARFMSRCLGYFVQDQSRKVTVLVATSGDTGGAVANGFYDVDGVDVVILYPAGKVSNVQELQLTTLGKNITAIEIAGNFDDCQQLVKQSFADEQLNEEVFLTSANSINVARWLPQQFYYFYACQQWRNPGQPPVICVPSGNFGNICAGLVAHVTGLPVKHFVAAVNANASFHQYIETGEYKQTEAIATLSNAMDVGNPSNFIRILELFQHEYPQVKNTISSYSISDEETRNTLQQVYKQFNYLLDPHGAVAFAALAKYQQKHANQAGVILETAHPVKFLDVVEPIIGDSVLVPETIKNLLSQQKSSVKMKTDYNQLKEFLVSR